jgi:hypothetical protein
MLRNVKVVQELQQCFAFLLLSNRKYLNPTSLLQTLSEQEGNPTHKGAQEDPTGMCNQLVISFELFCSTI